MASRKPHLKDYLLKGKRVAEVMQEEEGGEMVEVEEEVVAQKVDVHQQMMPVKRM